MKENSNIDFLEYWHSEFRELLRLSRGIEFVIFSLEGRILEKNFDETTFETFTIDNLINPTFNKLLSMSDGDIFEGYFTVGDYTSINLSYYSKVFKKGEQILIIFNCNDEIIKTENNTLQLLNAEISELHRELQREKSNLKLSMLKIKESNIRLAKYNSDQNHFLSILAHDLKTPFNSIIGYTSLLQSCFKEYTDDEVEKQLGIVFDVSSKAYTLLVDLLSWANSQSGNINFKPSIFLVENAIKKICELLEYQASLKSITLECNVNSTGKINADENMLKTILRNLISNAIKFTPKNGEIILLVESDEDNYIFSVRDSGVGISSDEVSKIFDSHVMYTTYGTNNEKGTGLGLALCQEFVKYHKGAIWVESEIDQGSQFVFTIPKSL